MSWEGFVKKGEEYIEKGDYDKAIECFEKALEECPEDKKWEILDYLGFCYYSKEDYDKAIKYLKESLKVCPEDKNGRHMISWEYAIV